MDSSQSPMLNEKSGGYDKIPAIETQQPAKHSSRERFTRRTLPALVFAGILWLIFRAFFAHQYHHCPRKPLASTQALDNILHAADDTAQLVPFEAHIMSKCPDARDCLQKMVVPAMVEISDKVNFTLSYIGSVDPDSDEIACMHGPAECLGNIIQLCAAKVYPDPKIYLGFANCMMSQYQDIPKRELVEECALEHAVDFGQINACISDEGEGMGLLRASVERSRLNHVRKSCTVRVAGKVRCIRDGGEWYDCPGGDTASDVVADIKDLYNKQNS